MDTPGPTHQRYEIEPHEIVFGSIIGEGTYGVVYEGVCRALTVAIKKPRKQTLDLAERDDILREIAVMSAITHPNVCLFLGACIQPNNILIVTELLEKDLNKILLRDQTYVALWQRLEWAKQAITGIAWLHLMRPPLLHRDIKLANMLLTHEKIVKVCDFGMSRFVEPGGALNSSCTTGTPLYMSPEVMTGAPVSTASDIYSFGVSLWEFVSRQEAFSHHTTFSGLKKSVVIDNERPAIPADCPSQLAHLLTLCWAPNPADRPDATTVVNELSSLIEEEKIQLQWDKVVAAIPFDDGRRFWYYAFADLEVPWDLFIQTLFLHLQLALPANYNTLSPDTAAIHCVKELICSNDLVHAAKFGKIVGCFAPLDAGLIQRVHRLMSLRWFHGDLPTPMAENLLMTRV